MYHCASTWTLEIISISIKIFLYWGWYCFWVAGMVTFLFRLTRVSEVYRKRNRSKCLGSEFEVAAIRISGSSLKIQSILLLVLKIDSTLLNCSDLSDMFRRITFLHVAFTLHLCPVSQTLFLLCFASYKLYPSRNIWFQKKTTHFHFIETCGLFLP